jgi:hypothetical protein
MSEAQPLSNTLNDAFATTATRLAITAAFAAGIVGSFIGFYLSVFATNEALNLAEWLMRDLTPRVREVVFEAFTGFFFMFAGYRLALVQCSWKRGRVSRLTDRQAIAAYDLRKNNKAMHRPL